MAEPFAPPQGRAIPVASAPTGGQGLALDATGKLPAGVLFAGTAARRIDLSSALILWPGASTASTVLTASHHLGVVPVIVLAQIFSSTGVALAPYLATINNYTTTTFDVQAVTTGAAPANTATTTIVWIAIG